MFGENGLGNNGSDTAGPNDSHKAGAWTRRMMRSRTGHPTSFSNSMNFKVIWISPETTGSGHVGPIGNSPPTGTFFPESRDSSRLAPDLRNCPRWCRSAQTLVRPTYKFQKTLAGL